MLHHSVLFPGVQSDGIDMLRLTERSDEREGLLSAILFSGHKQSPEVLLKEIPHNWVVVWRGEF